MIYSAANSKCRPSPLLEALVFPLKSSPQLARSLALSRPAGYNRRVGKRVGAPLIRAGGSFDRPLSLSGLV